MRRLLEQQAYRYEYTYKGVVRQMRLFFKTPWTPAARYGWRGFCCAHVPHDELAAL